MEVLETLDDVRSKRRRKVDALVMLREKELAAVIPDLPQVGGFIAGTASQCRCNTYGPSPHPPPAAAPTPTSHSSMGSKLMYRRLTSLD